MASGQVMNGAVDAAHAGQLEMNLLVYRTALIGAAVFLLLGLCAAFRIQDSDAAATMKSRQSSIPATKPVKAEG